VDGDFDRHAGDRGARRPGQVEETFRRFPCLPECLFHIRIAFRHRDNFVLFGAVDRGLSADCGR
jgi:hypothetical protein